jgi:hypothetical protein
MVRLRPFIAVLLALLLLGAQQAAFAHMIGHLGAALAAIETAATGNGDGDGETLGLSHVCTACVSLSALDGAASCGIPPGLTFEGAFAAPIPAAAVAIVAPAGTAYLARAPPAIL